MIVNHLEGASNFFDKAIRFIANKKKPLKILDFGCGAGQLARELQNLGYDVFGCDVYIAQSNENQGERFRQIQTNPYNIPFENETFDIVLSTSVLEHAQNTEEFFLEIKRVLKTGGYAMHILPGKYYLPTEPHLYVPLVSWFWPKCPDWWLALWAFLGIRNEFQKKALWRDVYKQNKVFCEENLCYHPTKYYEQLSNKIFGNFSWPMVFYIEHSSGGFAKLARKLPFKSILGKLSREIRMGFLAMQKR